MFPVAVNVPMFPPAATIEFTIDPTASVPRSPIRPCSFKSFVPKIPSTPRDSPACTRLLTIAPVTFSDASPWPAVIKGLQQSLGCKVDQPIWHFTLPAPPQ